MSSSTPMRRSMQFSRRLTGALALLVVPSVASAHLTLRRSEPAKGVTMLMPFTRITLWFTERPQLVFSSIHLFGPNGEVQLDSVISGSGNAIQTEVRGALQTGNYTVRWQTASSDGHVARGEFSFKLTLPPAVASTPAVTPIPGAADSSRAQVPSRSVPAPDSTVSHVESNASRGVRWMEFVALLTVLGALGFRHGVLPPVAARGVPTKDAADRARRLGRSAVGLYLIAVSVRLYEEAASLHGAGRALDIEVLRPIVVGTTWGFGWLAGAIGAMVVFIGWTISKRNLVIGTPLALVGAVGMLASPGLSGHAAAGRFPILSVALDSVHVAAAGVWVGGLLMVMIAGIPAMRRLERTGASSVDGAVATLIHSFHPIALFCAPVVVVVGLGAGWLRLGSISALWPSDYGRVLLLKIALVLCVAGVGFYNWTRGRTKLGDTAGTRHIRRSGSVELIFAMLVLAATSVLVSTPLPTVITPP